MAFNRHGINMALGFFVVPLLIASAPDFSFTTAPANKGQINIVLRQGAVGVDVSKFVGVCSDCRWVIFVQGRVQLGNSISFAQLFRAGVLSGVYFLAHGIIAFFHSPQQPVPQLCVVECKPANQDKANTGNIRKGFFADVS